VDVRVGTTAIPVGLTLSGIVTDAQTNQPISGTIVAANGRSSVSGGDGRYSIAGLSNQTYTLTANHAGYLPFSATLNPALTPSKGIALVFDPASCTSSTLH
jgi:hypothetical protein